MGYCSNNKQAYMNDGIPYLWNSGDVVTAPTFLTKITAFDGAANDTFGDSVAVGSGRIVIGAYGDDDKGTDSGSVYIYDLNGNFITKITAFDGAANDNFGNSVAVGSGRIVVGAYLDDDKGINSGSVYVYDLNGNLITKIIASDGAANDYFGISVAVGSGRIVISAYFDDDKGINSGSVYVYDLNGNFITKIIASDGAANDYFGISVAVGSGRIVVGAPYDDDTGTDSGSVYIYDLNGNFITKITAFDGAANDNFGNSVAVGSGRIVVGAYLDDDKGTDSGSVYIYDLNGNFITKITAFDGAANDNFGNSVAVGSGRIVISAYFDDDKGINSGSVYVYDLDGNLITKITAFDGAANDTFGNSVAVGSGRIVIGAYGDDDKGTDSGSIYIYTTPNVYNIYDAFDLQGG